jgi:hypothetical protein
VPDCQVNPLFTIYQLEIDSVKIAVSNLELKKINVNFED